MSPKMMSSVTAVCRLSRQNSVPLDDPGRPAGGENLQTGAVKADVDCASGLQTEGFAHGFGHNDAAHGVDGGLHWE